MRTETRRATFRGQPLRRLLFAARERFERNGGPYGRLVLTSISRPTRRTRSTGCSRPKSHTCRAATPGSGCLGSMRSCASHASPCRSRRRWSLSMGRSVTVAPSARQPRPRGTRPGRGCSPIRRPGGPELARLARARAQRFGGASPERTAIVLQALDVLSALPAEGQPLAALAASRAGGDAHALDRTRPLGRIIAAALFALEGATPREPSSADEWRALWARVGISCDELSCTALTLGLRPHRLSRGYLAGRLRAAGRAGRPLVLTLAELRAEPPRLALATCCSSARTPRSSPPRPKRSGPAVHRCCAPSGWPNTAVAMVLDAAESAGLEILVHADSDHAGAAIAATGAEAHRREAVARGRPGRRRARGGVARRASRGSWERLGRSAAPGGVAQRSQRT